MNPISFMTANFVARQVGYQMTRGWGQGDNTTADYFRPEATFAQRFDEYLRDIQQMGFEAIDLWTAILNPNWATDRHIQSAKALLDKYNFPVLSLAGWFGSTVEEFEATCKLASAFGKPVLGGSTSVLERDRASVMRLLDQYDLQLGLENHPEKNPQELLAKIGDGGDRIGAAVDTGWFGTQGYDAAQALDELNDVLFLVHLKDVKEEGAHDTCRFGEGVVPIEACVETLKRNGYTGSISVEHEPELSDPTEDCIASLNMLKGWLAQ